MQSSIRLRAQRGFTLVELAIVLVIIGLIVGGVLVGQDLIKAAEINATTSQIEKYNAAVNTFRGKYNGFPGDISTPGSFGLSGTGGNGNGIIEAGPAASGAGSCTNIYGLGGETALFWNHLSATNLIPDGVTTISAYTTTTAIAAGSLNDTYLPAARLGVSNRINVFSFAGRNYYGLSNFRSTTAATCALATVAALSPLQSFQVDSKIDDGNAMTGMVVSVNDFTAPITVAGGAPGGTMTATACYANAAGTTSGTAYTQGQYNTAPDVNANGLNCQLRLRSSF